MASTTDAVIGDHDGRRLRGSEVREMFAQIRLTGNVTSVPPLVVAKTAEAYEVLVAAIQAAGGGEVSPL